MKKSCISRSPQHFVPLQRWYLSTDSQPFLATLREVSANMRRYVYSNTSRASRSASPKRHDLWKQHGTIKSICYPFLISYLQRRAVFGPELAFIIHSGGRNIAVPQPLLHL